VSTLDLRIGSEPEVELGALLVPRMRESDGTVYYIDKDHPSASNVHAGTSESQPWATFAAAFRTTGSGGPANNGIVKVKKGATPYAGALGITRDNGSEANLVTVEAYDPNDPPIIGGTTPKTRFQSGAGYWRLRNLIADGSSQTTDLTDALWSADGCDHIEWYGVTARYGVGTGVDTDAGVQGFQPDNCADLWYINCLSHSNGSETLDHGWYVESGQRYYFWNCIAYGNAGYGWHLYNGSGTSEPAKHMFFYNCLADDQGVIDATPTGRAGWIINSDHANLVDANIWTDCHFYNCMSTNHITRTGDFSNRWGYRFASTRNQTQTTINNWTGGFPKFTINNSLAYNNVSGDVSYRADGGASEASVLTRSGLLLATNPLYVDQPSKNFRLQSGSPARAAGLADYTPPIDFTGATRTVADLGPYAYGS
jgi:hypothetical protein